MVYLENNLTRGAFTADRIQLLQLLGAQAAVSLENAMLVDDLEGKVRERTIQLERRNEYIRKTFGRYVSDDIVAAVLDEPAGTELGGELRDVTVLMADLRGFSTAVRDLPPQRVLEVINNFLEVQTRIVLEHGGTIDEVLGDAMLVLFGAPVSRADDRERAVRCALAMQLAMDEVNQTNEASGLPRISMGIGIHAGEAVVGNIGTEERTKYGVVGSVVNMAARIESLTTPGQVLVSDVVRETLVTVIETRDERTVAPKGAPRPIRVFAVTAITGEAPVRLPSRKTAYQRISPRRVELASVSDVDVGERMEVTLVAVSDAGALLEGRTDGLAGDIRLYLPGAPEAQVYAKVVHANEHEELEVAFTAIPENVRDALLGAQPPKSDTT